MQLQRSHFLPPGKKVELRNDRTIELAPYPWMAAKIEIVVAQFNSSAPSNGLPQAGERSSPDLSDLTGWPAVDLARSIRTRHIR